MSATRIEGSVLIDGILSEPEWQRPSSGDFLQRQPDEGQPATQRTEVWVSYDDAALYIAARMHDSAPDSIVSRIGRRDSDLGSDWFHVGLDPYHDKRTGFFFSVNPAGSIGDGTLFDDEADDDSWDGVWDRAARIDEHGWTVELRIPFSQLRFRNIPEQTWGINFMRRIQRLNEESWFVMVPKKESGGVSRYALLTGIRDIVPPPKIEILPYIASSGTFQRSIPGDPFRRGSSVQGSIGGDIRAGLGSNIKLDATFNPDFGQVEVDPAVVNLSQFETFFEEKRPFFIEGSNFFRFGRGGANGSWGFNWAAPEFFYSRRIGRPPAGTPGHSGYTDFPDRTTILGAGKVTGKLSDEWSIGVLQVVAAREHAEIDSSGVRFQDEVEPPASFSVARTLGEFGNGRHGLGFLATGLLRSLSDDHLKSQFNSRSFSFGMDGWTRLDDDQTWALTAWTAMTHIEGSTTRIIAIQRSPLHYFQRPDAEGLGVDSVATSLTGYAGRVALNKQKGNWQVNAAAGFVTPGFDSNDMGFLFRTDVLNAHAVVGYQWFDPDGVFREKGFRLATFRNFNFEGRETGQGYFLFYNAQLMNYWGFYGSVNHQGAAYDTRGTRGGPSIRTTRFYGTNLGWYSDSRSDVILSADGFAGRSESGGYIINLSTHVRWKPSSNVSIGIGPGMTRDVTIAHWVANVIDPSAVHTYGTRHIFGKLDQKEISANIRLDWTFTPELSLQLFVQPLLSVGRYSEFKELAFPGVFRFNTYVGPDQIVPRRDEEGMITGYDIDPDGAGSIPSFRVRNPDFNFKSLRGNAILRWEYLPGSTLFLAWTQRRVNTDDPGDFRFRRDFSKLLSANAENVFLIKAAYWITP